MSLQQILKKDDESQTLKRWLKKRYPQVTFSQWQKWFRTGQIRLDGKRVKGTETLTEHQILRLPPMINDIADIPHEKNPTYSASPKDIEEFQKWIIEENNHYLILNKPSGIAVQGGSGIRKHIDGLLTYLYPDLRPKLVHRIDKETSGLLIVAKHHESAQQLTEGFRNKTILKTYLAVVEGTPSPKSGRVKHHLHKAKQSTLELMRICDPTTPDAKYSETVYKTLSTNTQSAISALDLSPLTGRTHQLRVHCQSLNCPILGDSKYNPQTNVKKLHLHAYKIKLPETMGGKTLCAPIPEYFRRTLTKFNLSL